MPFWSTRSPADSLLDPSNQLRSQLRSQRLRDVNNNHRFLLTVNISRKSLSEAVGQLRDGKRTSIFVRVGITSTLHGKASSGKIKFSRSVVGKTSMLCGKITGTWKSNTQYAEGAIRVRTAPLWSTTPGEASTSPIANCRATSPRRKLTINGGASNKSGMKVEVKHRFLLFRQSRD